MKRILLLLNYIKLPIITGWCLFTLPVLAQVYNYEPTFYSNFETNPSFLIDRNNRGRIRLIQHFNPGASERFYHSSVKMSTYLPEYFTGIGVVVSNTIQDSSGYLHAGLALAYRNVLFNRIKVKLGGLYKANYIRNGTESFDLYALEHLPAKSSSSNVQNANISVQFSNMAGSLFIAYNRLNVDLPWRIDTTGIFPDYQTISIGNPLNLIDRYRNYDLIYTYLEKRIRGSIQHSHFILAGFPLNLTRRTVFKYGGRVGKTGDDIYHFTPMIAILYHENIWRFREAVIRMSADFRRSSDDKALNYGPVAQLSILLNL